MAFLRFANALVIQPQVSSRGWSQVRRASLQPSSSLVEQASEVLGEDFDPSKYLLTHSTIVASVDVASVPNVKLGKIKVGSKTINRKYSDYLIKPESDPFINNNCFPPGTPVTLSDGTLRPIEDVRVGDEVLTHNGHARRVTRLYEQDHDGELVEIKYRSTNERVYTTLNHPFFVFRANTTCVNCGRPVQRKLKTISHLLGRFYCSQQCYYEQRRSNAEFLAEKQGQFVEAGALIDHSDFVSHPVSYESRSTGLTLGQARLLGLFLAEGYYELNSRNSNSRMGVCWAFHENEENTLAQTVISLMEKEFGVECVIRRHPNDKGIHVTTKWKPEIVPFFERWVRGADSTTKTLDSDIVFGETNIITEVLRGWFEGGGCLFDTKQASIPGDVRLSGVTASRSLANQLKIMLQRIGISPRLLHRVTKGRRRLLVDGEIKVVSDPSKECQGWEISCGGAWIEDLVVGTVYGDSYVEALSLRGGTQAPSKLRFINGYCLQMVESTSRVEYSGKVYNLEVEGEHSYIAGGVAVHNCDSWSREVLLDSYQTFIGASNYLEHVQIEEQSKGKVIDAVARDIGPSIYVDILVATDLKHTGLIKDIRSGVMGTLSMGCFLPGTMVSMADGTRVPIEDVQPGDMVLTHKGRAREVLNKQIRGGKWDIRRIRARGIPSEISATDNHPFFVFQAAEICACGCGEPLSDFASKSGIQTTRTMTRRFKRGHDKRVFNPKNTYSLDEYRARKSRMVSIREMTLKEVRASELKIGDFLCFPKTEGERVEIDGVTVGRARLLGYFLAEGSFLKRKGEPVEVQFNFSLKEKHTYVAEVVRLLQQEFHDANDPWIQDRVDRNTCTVHIWGRDVAAWFYQHGGEYGHQKKMSAEVMCWPVEMHRHIIGAWINGDGTLHSIHGSTSGTTTSYALACQMHMLMARCGVYSRMECLVAGHAFDVREAVNGGVVVRDEATGKLPAFTLSAGQTDAQPLTGYCDKIIPDPTFKNRALRVLDDVVMFPITSIEADAYQGWVHDMEVEEDHSYVVEGVAVHNCSVESTTCTKCGNVAADETELCDCVRYEKGNYFIDEQGIRRRVAELCGHPTMEPHSGVTFLDASWVKTPAFTGAVLRNIIHPSNLSDAVAKRAQAILASPPAEWDANAPAKVASLVFAEGWGDEAETPAEPEAEPAESAGLDKLVDDVYTIIQDKVRDRVDQEIAKKQQAPPEASTGWENDTVIKEATRKYASQAYRGSVETLLRTASNDAAFVDALSSLNQSFGINLDRSLYRASIKVGSTGNYDSMDRYFLACRRAVGRSLSPAELRVMVRIGKLLNRLGKPRLSSQET